MYLNFINRLSFLISDYSAVEERKVEYFSSYKKEKKILKPLLNFFTGNYIRDYIRKNKTGFFLREKI